MAESSALDLSPVRRDREPAASVDRYAPQRAPGCVASGDRPRPQRLPAPVASVGSFPEMASPVRAPETTESCRPKVVRWTDVTAEMSKGRHPRAEADPASLPGRRLNAGSIPLVLRLPGYRNPQLPGLSTRRLPPTASLGTASSSSRGSAPRAQGTCGSPVTIRLVKLTLAVWLMRFAENVFNRAFWVDVLGACRLVNSTQVRIR